MMRGTKNTRLSAWLWLIVAALLAFGPLVMDGYALTLMTLVFLFAFLGLAWNLTLGYAGILSLGHALFFGVGGYTTAVLAEKYGIVPWFGIPIGGLFGAVLGAAIAWLGFRFAVRGVYFALMTIAFAEFTRILFDHWDYVGASGGFFFHKLDEDASKLVNLRGSGTLFYFGFLALVTATYFGIRWMINGKLGFYWRSLREDPEAAEALGVKVLRMQMLNVAISAFLTGIGGGMFALMNGSLFPSTMFGMSMSIEMIIAPILGGLGTLSGPLIGALLVVPVRELSNEIGRSAGIFGMNTLVYGVLVLIIITFMPKGVGPKIRDLLTGRLRRAARGGKDHA